MPPRTIRNLDFFTCTTSRKSTKLFTQKLSCNMPVKLDAILCDYPGRVVRTGFIQHTPDKSVLVNNFADLPDVRVNISTFRPVVGGGWN